MEFPKGQEGARTKHPIPRFFQSDWLEDPPRPPDPPLFILRRCQSRCDHVPAHAHSGRRAGVTVSSRTCPRLGFQQEIFNLKTKVASKIQLDLLNIFRVYSFCSRYLTVTFLQALLPSLSLETSSLLERWNCSGKTETQIVTT
ncbi:uncharacterized protein LOC122543919 isoform X5 [Chiloscyllium plagiosum]|uniref:uncharacterized protein LOC122543919 isoform X5 n=1 Tax=Chiloscyllium plagiosum TaxID=36176 RepID=UPI001CB85DE7|nr:uncharacterized protein LOC122543919 isoform X5 [Chiloscyllium plagiosum]